jgi:signal transduction histidine kinase
MEPERQSASPASPNLPEVVVRTLRHEVGDLLQTVYATAAILQERLPADWALERRIVGDLRTRGEACKNLLDAVHDLICPMMLTSEPVNLAELASALVGTAAARHPQLQMQAEGGPVPTVRGDSKRLAQLAQLLLSHACQRARKQVVIRTQEGREGVEWVVTDDGPEMPADQLERLFTPFATTRHTFGTLAVALAQKIAQLHGGRVEAANRPEAGFRVQAVLPTTPPGRKA